MYPSCEPYNSLNFYDLLSLFLYFIKLIEAVIEKAVDYAKSSGCYKVMLLSGSARKPAHEFYRSLGFNDKVKKGFHLELI